MRRLRLALLLLLSLAAPAFGQGTATRTLSVGATPAPPVGTTVRLDGLGTVGGTLGLFTDGDGDVFERLFAAGDIPSVFTRRDIAETIPAAWTFNAGVTIGGNLTFTGTGRRILGDFSATNLADRLSFQTSTTNGTTIVQAIPNGTATGAAFVVLNQSTASTSAFGGVVARSDRMELFSNADGTAVLPLTLYTSGAERMRLDAAGVVEWGTSVPSIKPLTNYGPDFGAPSRKYRSIHAGELFIETIVAQERIATMGGRFTVTPANVLTRNLTSSDFTGTYPNQTTTLCVKYNSFLLHVGGVDYGSRFFMEKAGQVEAFLVLNTTVPTIDPTFGDYCYGVWRNIDGTSTNDWLAGDGIIDTGKTGSGMIDQFAVHGLTNVAIEGPSIDFLVRTGGAWNELSHRASIGNLNNRYGVTSDTFGFAAGDPTDANLLATATSIKLRDGTTDRLVLDGTGGTIQMFDEAGLRQIYMNASSGVLIGNTTVTNAPFLRLTPTMIRFEVAGAGVFPMTINGTTGDMTLAGDMTVGGAGSFVGAGITIDTTGITASVPSGAFSDSSSYRFVFTNGVTGGGLYAYDTTTSSVLSSHVLGTSGTDDYRNSVTVNNTSFGTAAATAASGPAGLSFMVLVNDGVGTSNQLTITKNGIDINGFTTETETITVRNSAGTGTCTVQFVYGLKVGGSC